jgi:hypothetical protein
MHSIASTEHLVSLEHHDAILWHLSLATTTVIVRFVHLTTVPYFKKTTVRCFFLFGFTLLAIWFSSQVWLCCSCCFVLVRSTWFIHFPATFTFLCLHLVWKFVYWPYHVLRIHLNHRVYSLAELISMAYQPWYSVFLSQQNSHSRLISRRNSLPNRVNIRGANPCAEAHTYH